jgi:hypothetical protein|tara:strand:- start:242 stop:412 length:171 start_codon:yes stop_codon:yes gene_type:complete
MNTYFTNSKQWQKNSDGWVTAMTKSKDNKEEYKKYLNTTENPVPYRDWLREIKNVR